MVILGLAMREMRMFEVKQEKRHCLSWQCVDEDLWVEGESR